MNGKQLLEKFSNIDSHLIEEAENIPRKKNNRFIGFASVTATAAAAALIAVMIGHNSTQNPPVIDPNDSNSTNTTSSAIIDSNTSSEPTVIDTNPKEPPKLDFSKYKDLPKITDADYKVTGMGGGKEEYLNYSELVIRGPWNGETLETMPVYMSHSTELTVNLDRMYALARDAATALGIPADSLTISDNFQDMAETIEFHRKLGKEAGASDEEIDKEINRIVRSLMSGSSVQAKADGITISVDTAFCTTILFDNPITLPDNITLDQNTSDSDKAKLFQYFAENYKELTSFRKPAYGNGTIFKTGGFSVYESDCGLSEQVVNYWINSIEFIANFENANSIKQIRIYSDENCEKLSDYPILTAEQAEAILKSTRYDDKTRMPVNAKILKVDLVYRNLAGSTGVIPYYKFYVETDKEVYFDKEVTCDVYTIAAVPEEFIEIDTKDYAPKA